MVSRRVKQGSADDIIRIIDAGELPYTFINACTSIREDTLSDILGTDRYAAWLTHQFMDLMVQRGAVVRASDIPFLVHIANFDADTIARLAVRFGVTDAVLYEAKVFDRKDVAETVAMFLRAEKSR